MTCRENGRPPGGLNPRSTRLLVEGVAEAQTSVAAAAKGREVAKIVAQAAEGGNMADRSGRRGFSRGLRAPSSYFQSKRDDGPEQIERADVRPEA
jgi:hypothetical protein